MIVTQKTYSKLILDVVGWRAVFGRAKRGATREVDRRITELRRVDPKDWE